MIWHDGARLFAMGGYALYVWGSFLATGLALVVEIALARKRGHDIERAIRHAIAGKGEDV